MSAKWKIISLCGSWVNVKWMSFVSLFFCGGRISMALRYGKTHRGARENVNGIESRNCHRVSREKIRNKLIGFVTQRWFLFHCLLLNIKGETKLRKKNRAVNANLISPFFVLVELKIFKGFSSFSVQRNWLWFMGNNAQINSPMMKVNNTEISIHLCSRWEGEGWTNLLLFVCWEFCTMKSFIKC